MKEFNECGFRKKVVPMMPNGKHPNFENLPFYRIQREEKENKKGTRVMDAKRGGGSKKDWPITQVTSFTHTQAYR